MRIWLFKGNLVSSSKQFAQEYENTIDWGQTVNLETESFETVMAKIRGASTFTDFVTDIDYNEKGQRTEIYYENGSKTAYTYDVESFRLTRLLTTRNTGQDILQDINYTYDAVGNIVEIEDDAQQTYYYSNTV
ncbi:MAG: hypothetical protein U9R19_17220, partial [Bacteroidota bacterium]|nr:hypothetical protein [Bacteroidota bacterium]